MSDETLHVIAEMPNVCKHIHLPVQSGSDKILKLMNRKYTREWYMGRVEAIRRIIPDCGLSTDIFVGYHDETLEDHELSLSLMREVGYDSAFMFKYSTYASKHLPDNVPEEEKIRRLNELIALQTEMSALQNKKDESKEFDVLVEGFSKRSRQQLCGRTEQNKMVVFDKGSHHIGETVQCHTIRDLGPLTKNNYERVSERIKAIRAAIQEIPDTVGGIQYPVGHPQHLLIRSPYTYPADSLPDERCSHSHRTDGLGLDEYTDCSHEQYELLRQRSDCRVGTNHHLIVYRTVPRRYDVLKDWCLFPLRSHDHSHPDWRRARYPQPTLREDHFAATRILLRGAQR